MSRGVLNSRPWLCAHQLAVVIAIVTVALADALQCDYSVG
jgi:hypothetical protein